MIWLLTGGTDGGVHVTDVTNASRTLLMDLETLDWDDEILEEIDIPRVDAAGDRVEARSMARPRLARRTSRSPVILGDQQAALFGQTCLTPGEAKNTYGTGNFLLLNTGDKPVQSKNGLLTTLGYKMGSAGASTPGRCRRDHGCARPVVARQPGHDREVFGHRGACQDGR